MRLVIAVATIAVMSVGVTAFAGDKPARPGVSWDARDVAEFLRWKEQHGSWPR
jgi:hypothetical protein